MEAGSAVLAACLALGWLVQWFFYNWAVAGWEDAAWLGNTFIKAEAGKERARCAALLRARAASFRERAALESWACVMWGDVAAQWDEAADFLESADSSAESGEQP